MSNAGEAIHNWHIIDAKTAGGKEITTDLTAPHKASSVTFAISKPGIYHFQCDVHPDTMKGTLTVNAS
jgi:plastocyanin